jgi:hypothetical protein
MSPVVIRPYAEADRSACLALLRSNVPEHFTPNEEAELDAFLSNLPGPYFVVAEAGAIVACGGIAAEPDDPQTGALCWGIVRNDRQGHGIGRNLTLHRCWRRRALEDTRRSTTLS